MILKKLIIYYCAGVGGIINSRDGGAAKARIDEITSGGAGYFFECVGSMESASMSLRATAPGGNVVLVGNPHSDMGFSRADYWQILRHQLTVTGTWNSSFTRGADDDWPLCAG